MLSLPWEGRDIELLVSPKDIRTSPYDLCANRSDRRIDDNLGRGDRWFESTSLRQPVCLTGASHGLHTLRRGFRGSMSLDETRERDVLAISWLAVVDFL